MDKERAAARIAEASCTACLACVNICPRQCMEYDNKANMPYIREDECIACGNCIRVCPVQKHLKEINIYAAYAKKEDLVRQSSSGGIFSLIAEEILKKNGVVFGAGFDAEFHVRHIGVTDIHSLDKIRRSKYVHSNVGNTYCDVKGYLNEGRTVLFSGTSCQVEGLLAYLNCEGINTDRLYTQDLVCHGTVMPEVWEKYLKEKCEEYDSKIKSVSFRDKKYGWFNFGIKIDFENGKTYFCDKDHDLYMQIFLSNLALKKSCYTCVFRGITNRKSDITLADFWSIYKNSPGTFHPSGTSLVMVNSLKGLKLFENIKNEMCYERMEANSVTRSETMTVTSVEEPVTRARFLEQIKYVSLSDAWQNCRKIRYGVWGSFNLRGTALRSGELVFHISNNSIVSLFSRKLEEYPQITTSNSHRKQMLIHDLKKIFASECGAYLENIDYMLIDFLEERFGVWKPDEDHYLTVSDAWNDTGIDLKDMTNCSTERFLNIWKRACMQFVSLLCAYMGHTKMILVRMLLSAADEMGNKYANIREIEQVNHALEDMYDLFLTECDKNGCQVNVIDVPEVFLYTQSGHKWGKAPEHLNPRAEAYLAAQIERMIRSEYL